MIRIRTFKESPENQLYRNPFIDIHKELGKFIFEKLPDLIEINKEEEFTDYFINIPNRIHLPYMGNFESSVYVVWYKNCTLPQMLKKEEIEHHFDRANDSILYEGNLIDCEKYLDTFFKKNKFLQNL